MPTQTEIRESIKQQIIYAIDQGVRPWVKPWKTTGYTGPSCNAETGKNNSGVNPLILNLHIRSSLDALQWNRQEN
ncbi:MAG: ArdC family protein [Planctomycetota bacterium]